MTQRMFGIDRFTREGPKLFVQEIDDAIGDGPWEPELGIPIFLTRTSLKSLRH